MRNHQMGFTLIELVIVIVILGILAAAALPRFSDLSGDARVASINGLAGSLRSATAIAHATYLAKGYASNSSVSLDGTSISLTAGYPTAENISNALSDYSGFTIIGGTAGTASVQFQLRSSCLVEYGEATATASPTVVVTSSGCTS